MLAPSRGLKRHLPDSENGGGGSAGSGDGGGSSASGGGSSASGSAMSITVPNVALDGETYDVYPDDIRPLSPISPTAKRVRAEMGLDTLKIPDTAEEEADHDEVEGVVGQVCRKPVIVAV